MTGEDALSPERVAGLRSGDRDAVRTAISGVPRSALSAWLRTAEGELVLRDAFARMPEYYVGGILNSVKTVRWRVHRAPAPDLECYLVVGPHDCTVEPTGGDARPDVTLSLDAVSFVELAAASRAGMDLLQHGELHIQGDVQLAIQLESLFGLGQEKGP